MSTHSLIEAVLTKLPDADQAAVLDLIVACDADLNRVLSLLGVQPESRKRQMTFDSLTSLKPAKTTKTSADTVVLHNSEQVAHAGVYCSLHSNVLDSSTANQLAVTLMGESHLWRHRSFYLFDRKVTSGHSSALYTDDDNMVSGKVTTSYQGTKIPSEEVFKFPPELSTARDIIEGIVRKTVPEWASSVVLINKYADKSEKLDFHSDQLTYIGTKPLIAALSLGCTREFRLKDRSVPPKRPSYSIMVPHNSLLIMHGGCQEYFKHSIPPMKSVDEDPLLGSTRLSLTFRMYRPELNDRTLPKCQCKIAMILRNTLPDKNGDYKYIWQCAKHYQGGKGCNETRTYTPMCTELETTTLLRTESQESYDNVKQDAVDMKTQLPP